MSQSELSEHFGFKDRQTLSAIETGERRVTVDELLRAAEIFAVPLEIFTDPFRLIGEGQFSWRQSGVPSGNLAAYQEEAGQLIAAYRTLAEETGEAGPLLRVSLPLTKRSSFEEAVAAGERLATEFDLGAVPAERLAETMSERLGIHVMMVDAIAGISGAALRLPQFDMVLINRNEPEGRRHFDLAHELFHILTWEEMPPEHVEEINPAKRSRVEQLADAFAGAVLMPATSLDMFGDFSSLSREDLVFAINTAADALRVSASALRWRLVAINRISQAVARDIPEAALRHNGRQAKKEESLPPLFSRRLAEVFAAAIDEGRLSVRRAAALTSLSIDDLAAMFVSHGLDSPIEL